MSDRPIIFITAAEASGDAHAAGLIAALGRRLPGARFVGIGGPAMAAAGCELLAEPVRRAAMTTGPFTQLGYFWKLLRRVKRAIKDVRPAVLVPVDSPALNWHLAKAARRRNVPVVYYVAPQVWAWAPWRVRKLRRLTDAVACILPFEEDYLRRRGVNAHFVGHPLFDELPPADPRDLDEAARTGRWRIALLPGSREGEIKRHAPALAEVMDRLRRRRPEAEFTLTAGSDAVAEMIRRHARRDDLPLAVGDTPAVLARSHFAVVASGTVTLEVAHFGVPMIVFYHVPKWQYRLAGRWIVRTPHLSLVNVLAERQLVPELMPWYGDAAVLADAAEEMLDDLPRLKRTRSELLELVAPLHRQAAAADGVAELVVKTMNQPRSLAGDPVS